MLKLGIVDLLEKPGKYEDVSPVRVVPQILSLDRELGARVLGWYTFSTTPQQEKNDAL